MNKKIIIPIVIFVVLLLIAGALFWWQQENVFNYLERKEFENVFAPSKDYRITENPEGRFVENKKDGFKAKILNNWKAKIGMDMFGFEDDKKVILYSTNFNYQPPQGCLIEIQINRVKNESEEGDFIVRSVEEVKREMTLAKESETKNHFLDQKVISVNGREALKQTFALEDNKGKHIIIEMPSEERVYSFEMVSFSEKCETDLEKFLDNISIE